tara:strand:+ start:959 stop:2890 length:1932 start_codon:yes stop_codon:yes gene_type:complete
MGVFSDPNFERSVTNSARKASKKSSMWDDTLRTFIQVGLVGPTASALAGEVGGFINKGAVAKHENWLQGEEAAKARRMFQHNREAKTRYDADEKSRIAANMDTNSWVRQKVAKQQVALYKERLANPTATDRANASYKDINNKVVVDAPQFEMSLPADTFDDSVIANNFLKNEIDQETTRMLAERNAFAETLSKVKTPEQVEAYLKRANPYSTSLIGNVFKGAKNFLTGKSQDEINQNSIAKLKESDFYKSSAKVQTAMKEYEEGADIELLRDTVNNVARSKDSLAIYRNAKYNPTEETVQSLKVVDGGDNMLFVTSQVIEDKLLGIKETIVLNQETKPLPKTERGLVKELPTFVSLLKNANLNEATERKIKEEVMALQGINLRTGKEENFNPLDSHAYNSLTNKKAVDILQSYLSQRSSYKAFEKIRADSMTNVLERMTQIYTLQGTTNMIGARTALEPEKFVQGTTTINQPWQKWFDDKAKADKLYAGIYQEAIKINLDAYLLNEGLSFFDPVTSTHKPRPDKIKQYNRAVNEFYNLGGMVGEDQIRNPGVGTIDLSKIDPRDLGVYSSNQGRSVQSEPPITPAENMKDESLLNRIDLARKQGTPLRFTNSSGERVVVTEATDEDRSLLSNPFSNNKNIAGQ